MIATRICGRGVLFWLGGRGRTGQREREREHCVCEREREREREKRRGVRGKSCEVTKKDVCLISFSGASDPVN